MSLVQRLAATPPWNWPETAGDTLLGVLTDRSADPEDRRLAARLAGDLVVMSDAVAEALLATAKDASEDADVRSAAAVAFGATLEEGDLMELDDPDEAPVSEAVYERIKQDLRALHADPDTPRDVRRMSLEALIRAPAAWHQDAVREAYTSDDPAWRQTAVFCMSYVKGFDAEILEALQSENEDIHFQAVRAAGERGLSKAWEPVAALVASEATDRDLRMAAIEAAAGIAPGKAQELFDETLDADDEELQDVAHDALTMAGVDARDDSDDLDWLDED